ncbi:hypothetical protein ACFYRY_31045 [Streptomyces sp. NPDC005263]|uniref:hypothetical protein n=1 Tax=Streptomyces sp. NPDC005263 TaxID=3364711 RepID=UPI0036C55E81
MAFGVEELRVLRRALALAIHPTPAQAEDVQDCLRLAESLDEAAREGARLRAFLVADLARYRAALPGTAAGYLTLLEEALGAGYRPDPDDLSALRALRGNPVAAFLLDRCQAPAEQDVQARPAPGATRRVAAATPSVPASRTRLLALPGGRSGPTGHPAGRDVEERGKGHAGAPPGVHPASAVNAGVNAADAAPKDPGKGPGKGPARDPERKPPQKPAERPERPERPAAPRPSSPAPKPSRPIPTPGEVFPRRKPAGPPPEDPPQQLAAG